MQNNSLAFSKNTFEKYPKKDEAKVVAKYDSVIKESKLSMVASDKLTFISDFVAILK